MNVQKMSRYNAQKQLAAEERHWRVEPPWVAEDLMPYVEQINDWARHVAAVTRLWPIR